MLVSRINRDGMHRNNCWNIVLVFLNIMLICSLSSLSVCGNMQNIVKAAIIQEDTYSKNFNVEQMKQNYCHYCIQDLNQTAEKKSAYDETITVPSLEGSDQWSSITKKTNDDLYHIKIGWDSTSLKTGRNTIFIINFLNHKTNLQEKQIEYSFKAMYPAANLTIKDAKHQKAPTGSGVQIVKFPMLGQLNILVNITFFQQQSYNITERNNIDNIASNKSENVSFIIMIPPNDVSSTDSLNTRI